MVQKKTLNPIKIIKLINGDDIVCTLPAEQLGDKSPLLRLSKPLQVKYIPQFTATGLKDYVALIKWSPYTKDFILTIPKDKILTITKASDDMSKNYVNLANDYDRLDQPKKAKKGAFIQEQISEEDNELLNEIFKDKFTKRTLH